MKINDIEINEISEWINNQEGQNYPCSNQVVICGFFGTREQWEDFVFKIKIKF